MHIRAEEAAKRVSKGCHKPRAEAFSPVYLENFDNLIRKLARNCKYSISEEDSKQFPKERSSGA